MDNKKQMDLNRIVKNIVRVVALLTLAGSILLGILEGRRSIDASHYFMNAFTCLILFVLTFVPAFISRKTTMILPTALQTGFLIFMFLAMLLGEVYGFYERFSWWDIMLHSSSAFMFGIVGFLLFDALDRDEKIYFELNRVGVLIFAFCFAVSLGALWEIFEFSGDMLFGMNMQKSVYVTNAAELAPHINKWGRLVDPGLVDTMEDLVVDAVGALVAVIVMHFAFRKRARLKTGRPAEGLEVLMRDSDADKPDTATEKDKQNV